MAGLVNRRIGRCVDLFSLDEVTMFRRSCFFLTTLVFVVTLTACTSSGKKWNPDDYTVKSGDTVYSIAWRYEIDPEDFAAWNNLKQASFIKAGQRLHTRKPYNFYPPRNQSYTANNSSSDTAGDIRPHRGASSETAVKAQKGDTLYSLSQRYDVSIERLAQLNQLKKPYIIQPGQTIFLQPLGNVTARTTNNSSTGAKSKPPESEKPSPRVNESWAQTVRWQRPVNGRVVKRFDRNRNDAKGIDIEGKLGDPIVAAADGKVVYSGDGLISYGNLIIIKHNKTFLSAYAYNLKLLVKEGDSIKAGQKIAEMGRKDDLSPRSHFEIRRNGKPDDPLKYIPW